MSKIEELASIGEKGTERKQTKGEKKVTEEKGKLEEEQKDKDHYDSGFKIRKKTDRIVLN